MKISILFLLGINAWIDIRKKEISLLSLAAAGIWGGILYGVGWLEWSSFQFMAFFPGILWLLFSKASAGKTGMGDGLLLCVMGIYLPPLELLMAFVFALLGISIYSSILLVQKKGSLVVKKRQIAFVPFLLGGYLGGLWI